MDTINNSKIPSSWGQENGLISRQSAIDAIGKTADELYKNIKKGATFPQRQWFDGMAHAQSILEDLPSAQQKLEQNTPSEHGKSDKLGVKMGETCTDTISRRKAFEYFVTLWECIGTIMDRDEWEDVCMTTANEIPSAQPEPIRINLNEPIKVKLTGWGKEIYYHQYDRTNQIAGREICKPMFPREDENGYTEFQLWCFIELYGMHMGMTLPNVIEPLEIVYER